MNEWFSSLSGFEQVYWGIALIASVFFVIVLISTVLGGGAEDFDGDVDADIDGDTGIGFQFFTFKNMVGFFTIFGWSGIAFIDAGFSKGMVVLLSSLCGLAMMFVMAFMIYQINKLVSSGTLKIKNAIGLIGEVYLTIGAGRSRIGKVQITVQGSLRELEAITDHSEDLPQATVVRVTDTTANGILIVEPFKTQA